jgi:wobble nucleotide-excising tRNase
MIERFQLIRNIGKFDSVNAGNLALGRLTVIYGENARGKTTLTTILRSLATGSPILMTERKRFDTVSPPHIVIECSGGPPPAVFQDNAWNRTLPSIAVFDDAFIDDNVYSGLAVESQHRQNLHELILGTRAVQLSRDLQERVTQVEAHNAALRTKATAIPVQARGPFTVDEFCGLPDRADINGVIQATERDIAAARERDAVRTSALIPRLRLPNFDLAEISALLERDLPALDEATSRLVQQHLGSIGERGEAWVAEGITRVVTQPGGGTVCPFCAQDLRPSAVIEHYGDYFSDAYAALKRMVSEALVALNRANAGDAVADFERTVGHALERRQFWASFAAIPGISLDTAAVARDWHAAFEAVVALLKAKQAAPLERVQVSDEVRSLVTVYDAHRTVVEALNQQIEAANQQIVIAKERAATANSALLETDLASLKAIEARHTPEMSALCDDYFTERDAKLATEQTRDRTKADLEQHRTEVFPGYQTAINLYLQRFGAAFRLDRMTFADTRGGPSCTYNVLINNTPVPVGGASIPPGQPSFRTALSAGDRNALALALFFAMLDQDPDLAYKTVVIDDPISSLDDHRSLATAQEIRRLAERAAQVIVLSHSKSLLARLWAATDPTLRTALQVVRAGESSQIRTWDVSEDSVTEQDRRHANMREFLADGTGVRREIASSIRPLLEAFLRVSCAADYPPGTLLGSFLNLCEQRVGTAQQVLDEDKTRELRDVVEYSNKFHHDTNPAYETEAINDGELRGFVERALRFIHP